MKAENNEIVDFYRQLSLLIDSNLPLPESLKQLAGNMRRRDFREVIDKLAEQTERGAPLSEAMKRFPKKFHSFHIRMIEGGEKSGTLPEILSEVAYSSHIDLQLVSMVKTIAAYPIFVIVFSASVLLLLYTFIVPGFQEIFDELLEGAALPRLTELTLSLSRFCVYNFPVLLLLFVLFIVFCIWLFVSNSLPAARIFLTITKAMPLAGSIFRNLMMARICSMWSVLVKQEMPTHEALKTIAGFVGGEKLSAALKRVSRKTFEGQSLVDSLKAEGAVSDMIAVAVKHAPENELQEELATLAGIYKDRAAGAIKNAGMTWELFLLIFMAVQVGFIVISLFMPLTTMIEKLGG